MQSLPRTEEKRLQHQESLQGDWDIQHHSKEDSGGRYLCLNADKQY
jgi:hypothetical protein